MKSSAVRVLRRAASYEQACLAFTSAHNLECIEALESAVGLEPAILRARAMLRLSQAECAIATLEENPPGGGASHAQKAAYYTILAAACVRSKKIEKEEAASGFFLEARTHAWSSHDPFRAAELAFYEALRDWGHRDLDSASLRARDAVGVEFGPHHARALELLGLISASREDYPSQVAFLTEGLDHLGSIDESDAWITASLLHGLSALVADLHLPSAADRINALVPTVVWTPELQERRFHIGTALGWSDAIRGNHLQAFRSFRECIDIAPSAPFRLVAMLSRVWLAKEMSENFMAREELEHAQDLASRIEWSKTDGEERYGLLLLAEIVATNQPALGQRYLDAYTSISRKLNPLLLARSDRRWTAMESQAAGYVALANHHSSVAVHHLHKAFDIFRSVGYTWRALRLAQTLVKITGEDQYSSFIRRHQSEFPNSWLARTPA